MYCQYAPIRLAKMTETKPTVLVRVWSNWNSHTVLVRV